jgi:uncharacterized protein involved in exopolysaccharide biosynthesis
MLWLHRLAILVVWLTASGITAVVVSMLPAEYQAEISILVEPQKIPGSVVQSMVTTPLQDRLQTISQQIMSTAQLQKVVDDFGLYKAEKKDLIPEEITQMMRKNIAVRMDKGWSNNAPGAFRVQYKGADPAVAAQVANRLGNMFIEANLQSRETTVEGTSEFLETQLQDAKKRLDDSEAQISAYRSRHNGELPEQVNTINGTLSRLEIQQNADRSQIARDEDQKQTLADTIPLAEASLNSLVDQDAEAELAAAQAASAAQNRGPAAAKAAAPPPRVLKDSEKLEIQLAADAETLGPAHPEIKRLKIEIAKAKAAEAKLGETLAQAAPPAPSGSSGAQQDASAVPPSPTASAPAGPKVRRERPEIGQARDRIRQLKLQTDKYDKEIAALNDDLKRIAQGIAETTARLNEVPVREQEIAQITRDHAALQQEYGALVTKSNAAKISTDMELRQKSERFTINDPAHVPSKPISPNRPILDLLGSLGGLILGLVGSFAQEFRKNRMLGAWELPEEVMVLAEVPRISPAHAAAGGFWSGWGWPRRIAVCSGVLAPILALLYAAKVYLR